MFVVWPSQGLAIFFARIHPCLLKLAKGRMIYGIGFAALHIFTLYIYISVLYHKNTHMHNIYIYIYSIYVATSFTMHIYTYVCMYVCMYMRERYINIHPYIYNATCICIFFVCMQISAFFIFMFHLLSPRRVWLQLDVCIVSWCVNSFCCSLLFGCRLNRFRHLNVFASDNAESIEVSKKFLRELDTSWHILALFCHGFPL